MRLIFAIVITILTADMSSQQLNWKFLKNKFWVTDQNGVTPDLIFAADTLRLSRQVNYVPFYNSTNPQFHFPDKHIFTLMYSPSRDSVAPGIINTRSKSEVGKWSYNKKLKILRLSRFNHAASTTDDDRTWTLKNNYDYKVIIEKQKSLILVRQN